MKAFVLRGGFSAALLLCFALQAANAAQSLQAVEQALEVSKASTSRQADASWRIPSFQLKSFLMDLSGQSVPPPHPAPIPGDQKASVAAAGDSEVNFPPVVPNPPLGRTPPPPPAGNDISPTPPPPVSSDTPSSPPPASADDTADDAAASPPPAPADDTPTGAVSPPPAAGDTPPAASSPPPPAGVTPSTPAPAGSDTPADSSEAPSQPDETPLDPQAPGAVPDPVDPTPALPNIPGAAPTTLPPSTLPPSNQPPAPTALPPTVPGPSNSPPTVPGPSNSPPAVPIIPPPQAGPTSGPPAWPTIPPPSMGPDVPLPTLPSPGPNDQPPVLPSPPTPGPSVNPFTPPGSAPPPTQPVIPASSPPPSTPGFPADAPPSPLNPSDPTGPTNPVDPATPDRPSSNPGSDDDFSGGGSGSGSGSGGSSGSDSRYPWLPGYNPGTGDHMEGSFPEYGSSDDFTDSRSSGSAEGIGAYLPAWGGASSSSLDGAAEDLKPDFDAIKFLLSLNCQEAAYFSCAAFGRQVQILGLENGAVVGCEAAALSDNLHTLAVEFAEEKANQTAFWVWALSAAGGTPSCPDMDLEKYFEDLYMISFNLIGSKPDPTFKPYRDDKLFLLGAFAMSDFNSIGFQGAVTTMTTPSMRAQAAMLLAGKAYQAGVIRSMLYQRLYDTISVPELSVSIGMQAATDAVTAYLNTIVGSEVIKPLVDASGAHLTNLNSKGLLPEVDIELGRRMVTQGSGIGGLLP